MRHGAHKARPTLPYAVPRGVGAATEHRREFGQAQQAAEGKGVVDRGVLRLREHPSAGRREPVDDVMPCARPGRTPEVGP